MCSSGASDQWAERCKQECDRTHADELLWAALDDGVLELVLAEEAEAAEVSTVCAAVMVTTEAEAAWVEVAAWDEEGAGDVPVLLAADGEAVITPSKEPPDWQVSVKYCWAALTSEVWGQRLCMVDVMADLPGKMR